MRKLGGMMMVAIGYRGLASHLKPKQEKVSDMGNSSLHKITQ